MRIDGLWAAAAAMVLALGAATASRTAQMPAVPQDSRGEQAVHVLWADGSEDVLKDIGAGTLDGLSDVGERDAFVAAVRLFAESVLQRSYAAYAVRFIGADDIDDDTHVVEMLPDYTGVYGATRGDCGNSHKGDRSYVYLGTFREELKRDLWTPMSPADSSFERVQDVGEAIGRTAVHEVAHALGLVACDWMPSDGRYHNGDDFYVRDGGFFLLDSGADTRNHARIGEREADRRHPLRTPATFNLLNDAYLRQLHPRQGGER